MTDLTAPPSSNGHTDDARAVIAAATWLTLDEPRLLRTQVAKRAVWQEDAWAYYDEVPEVKFGINYLANGMSKVRFYAAVANDEGDIVPIDDETSPYAGTPLATAAVEALARLRAPIGGQGEINRLVTSNLEVAGECYLRGLEAVPARGVPGEQGYNPGRPESWDVVSVSMIEWTIPRGDTEPVKGAIRLQPDGTAADVNVNDEAFVRLWQRHPRFPLTADSNIRGCMSDLEALVVLSNTEKAIAKSRMSAGVVLVAKEFSLIPEPPPPGAPAPDPPVQPDPNVPPPESFITRFEKALTAPIEDPAAPEAVVPLLVGVQGDKVQTGMKHYTFDRQDDGSLQVKISAKIDRVARGMNVPVEVVMGHMSTTFSNAEQIDQDIFDDHWEPRCIMVAEGYGAGFLRPVLLDEFEPTDVERVLVWYDPSALVRSSPPEDSVDDLWKDNLVSDATRRRVKGFDEDDAPADIQEFIRNLVLDKGQFGQSLTAQLLQKLGIDVEVVADEGPPAGFAGSAMLARQSRRGHLGAQLREIDRHLRDRLHGAADMSMTRALERAGNKLKTSRVRHVRDLAAAQRPYNVAAHLGPAIVADAGHTAEDLLEDAWGDLREQFMAWVDDAGQSALTTVSRALSGMTNTRRADLQVRMLRDAEHAWDWLEDAMTETAKRALFAPERGAAEVIPRVGEFDLSSRVPVGIIREALAIAGGANTAAPVDRTPHGGIALGQTMMGELRDEGVKIEAYRWVYGAAQRKPFPPHVDLDGAEFVNFDDDVLLNTSGFPESGFYYPGDHIGCVCDFEPIIIEPAVETVAASTTEDPDADSTD